MKEPLIFDMHGTPPTSEEMKLHLNRAIVGARFRFLFGGLASFVVMLLVGAPVDIKSFFVWAGAGVAAALLVKIFFTEKTDSSYVRELITPLGDKASIEALELCRSDSDAATYQNKVVAQGRQLVFGELNAMREFVRTKKIKAAKAELSQPVQANG